MNRDGTATDIATYNTFIQNLVAAGHSDIQTHSSGFRVVGCTEAVDARDNTGTTYTSTNKGIPIYWLNGNKVADDYEDFYDGSWDEERNDRNKNELGTDGPDTDHFQNTPLTGCDHDGTKAFTGSSPAPLATVAPSGLALPKTPPEAHQRSLRHKRHKHTPHVRPISRIPSHGGHRRDPEPPVHRRHHRRPSH